MQQFQSLQRLLLFYTVTLTVMLALYYAMIFSELRTFSKQHSIDTFDALQYDFVNHDDNVTDLDVKKLLDKPYFQDLSYQLIFMLPSSQTFIHRYTRPNDSTISTVVFPTISTPTKSSSNSAYLLTAVDLKGTIKLQNGHQLYVMIKHRPVEMDWISYQFWLPLMTALFLLTLALLYMLRRNANWRELLSYADNLGNSAKESYSPQPFLESNTTTEFMRLGHALSRISYQLHNNYRSIRTLNHRLERLVEQAPLPMLMLMRHGQISFSNKRFEQVFGISSDPNHSYQLTEFVSGLDDATQLWLKNLSTQRVMRTLTVKSLKDEQAYQLHITPWFGDHGQIHGFTILLNSINDFVKQTERLQRHNQSLQRQLNEANRTKAIIHHELTTPLDKITSMIQSIEPNTSLSKDLDILDDIIRLSSTMSNKLNEVLSSTKTESPKSMVTNKPVDIFVLGKQVIADITDRVHQQNLELLYFFAPNCPRYISTDGAKLKQILLTLLKDAIGATDLGCVSLTIDAISNMSAIPDEQPQASIINALDNNSCYWVRFTVQDTATKKLHKKHIHPYYYLEEAQKSTQQNYYSSKLRMAAIDTSAQLLGGYFDFGDRLNKELKDASNEIFDKTTSNEINSTILYLPCRQPDYTPVYFVNDSLSDVHLIAIVSHQMYAQHLQHLCQYLSTKCSVYTSIDQIEDIKSLVQKEQSLVPIILLDFELYETTYNQALDDSKKSNNQADIIRFLDELLTEKSLSTLLLSRKCARRIPATILDRFDGFLDKPLDVSLLLSELKRIALLIKKPQETVIPALTETTEPELLSPLVLVVEDSPTNQKITCKLLKKLGYRSVVADDGQKGLAQFEAQNEHIDLILMDCRMPIMDGFKATQAIRAQDSNIPIVALTANNTEADREACFRAGMNDFLSKPINKDNLHAVLQKFI